MCVTAFRAPTSLILTTRWAGLRRSPYQGRQLFQYHYDAASNETERDNYLSNPQLDQFFYRDELDRMSAFGGEKRRDAARRARITLTMR